MDPSGRHKPGDSVFLAINNEPPAWRKIVSMDLFYHVKITRDDSINFTQFGAANGDFIGVANDTSWQAVLMAVRPGNIGLLMAMHVTGKEIPNWTWQSFWWAMNPADSMGKDRPKSIPAPWNHYDMTIVYSFTHTNGSRIIAFNPYLETSLAGAIPNGPGNPKDSTAWTGVITHCMSLSTSRGARLRVRYARRHVVRSSSASERGRLVIFTQPYPGMTKRVPVLKTDFLWSLAIRGTSPTLPPSRRKVTVILSTPVIPSVAICHPERSEGSALPLEWLDAIEPLYP